MTRPTGSWKYKQRVKILTNTTQQNIQQKIYYATRQTVMSVRRISLWFSVVLIQRDICTHFGRYLYLTDDSWVIKFKISIP